MPMYLTRFSYTPETWARLAKNPEDGRGWEVVGPVYMRFGRFEDAVKARRNAIRLNGASADREADLGESLMALANVAEADTTGSTRTGPLVVSAFSRAARTCAGSSTRRPVRPQ